MLPFYAVTFSQALTVAERGSDALALFIRGQYPENAAWDDAERGLEALRKACDHLPPLKEWLNNSLKIERGRARLHNRDPHGMAAYLQDFAADLGCEIIKYEAFLIEPSRRLDYVTPLHRFGASAPKFPKATESMAAASRCYALDEWEASVFHSMNVLEHGIQWLAKQIQPTFKKPPDLASWGEILQNIQGQIDAEIRKTPPPSHQRSNDLAFYGRAASEFRYFQNAWRDCVMHERNDPFDEPGARRVLEHVATFMAILAERV